MNQLDIVDQLIGELSLLPTIGKENKQKLDKKFRLEFNYNSNHLEGNTLTYGETELLLIFGDTRGNHSMREYEEMKAHDVAYQLVEDWANDKEDVLTEQKIKELNQIILVKPFWKDAITPDGQTTRREILIGDYKKFSNSVRLENGEIFEYASPMDTKILMAELIDWYRSERDIIHPVTLAAMLHYKFVRIHPFDDGNGRVSRLLMNYVLLNNNLPPVIIKSKDKTNYLRALHLADVGDFSAFIEYIAKQLVWSLELSIKANKGDSIEEDDDLDKEISVFKKQLLKNDKLVSRNNPDIAKLYKSSIEPLFQSLLNKFSQFDDLFDVKKIYNLFDFSNRNVSPVESSLEDFDRFFDKILIQARLDDKVNHNEHTDDEYDQLRMLQVDEPSLLHSIELRLNYRGFKNDGTNTFGAVNKLHVFFNEYTYIINTHGQNYDEDNLVKKLYTEILTQEEINTVVKTCVSDLLNRIKSSISNKK